MNTQHSMPALAHTVGQRFKKPAPPKTTRKPNRPAPDADLTTDTPKSGSLGQVRPVPGGSLQEIYSEPDTSDMYSSIKVAPSLNGSLVEDAVASPSVKHDDDRSTAPPKAPRPSIASLFPDYIPLPSKSALDLEYGFEEARSMDNLRPEGMDPQHEALLQASENMLAASREKYPNTEASLFVAATLRGRRLKNVGYALDILADSRKNFQ